MSPINLTVQYGLTTDRKENIMTRVNTRPHNDKKVFKRTAASTKKINVKPKVMRGGTRM